MVLYQNNSTCVRRMRVRRSFKTTFSQFQWKRDLISWLQTSLGLLNIWSRSNFPKRRMEKVMIFFENSKYSESILVFLNFLG